MRLRETLETNVDFFKVICCIMENCGLHQSQHHAELDSEAFRETLEANVDFHILLYFWRYGHCQSINFGRSLHDDILTNFGKECGFTLTAPLIEIPTLP